MKNVTGTLIVAPMLKIVDLGKHDMDMPFDSCQWCNNHEWRGCMITKSPRNNCVF